MDLLFDVLGSIPYAAGLYTFAASANFAPGGISGLAIILNYLTARPSRADAGPECAHPAGHRPLLGRKFLLKSVKTMAISTLFLDLVFPLFPTYQGDPLLAALFAGSLIGVGLALIYMRGSSTGGADFVVISVKKLRPHLSLGQVMMCFDLLVILMGWPVYGNVDSVLYGAVAAFATSLVIDKVMYGLGAGKLVIVITKCGDAVARSIDEACERGSTLLTAMGSYTKNKMDVLLCACSQSEAYKVRAAAHQVDEDAFVMITETSEVFGEGFLDPKNT